MVQRRADDRSRRAGRRFDTEADLQLIRTLYAELGREFELSEIVDLLDRRPELRAINASVRQKPPD